MVVPRLIERKRDGHALEPAEWSELIRAYAAGQVPDYQMSALLMAICFRGLEPAELAALTDAMLASGDRLHFDGWSTPRVDKHSTGGVGDKTSLLLAPMLAAAGVAVPMMSGRGLGHTGGTLDKLEAIRGFRTDISLREAEAQVRRLNCALIGQTPEIAPADKRLYALRDVTATVESIPLIAASIMSKKLAEGLDGLVLDVKTGSGAFLPSVDDALTLARTMVGIGESRGCKVVALLTAMDRPLGRAAGNALEVREAVAGLRGHGPEDLMEVTFALGIEMLRVAGLATDAATARHLLRDTIQSGRALERLMQVVEAQGGDPAQIEHPERLPSAPVQELFTAPEDGVVVGIEPRAVGRAIVALGGGRATMDDVIDPSVGFVFRAVAGEAIKRGQPLVEIHARTRDDAEGAARALAAAITLGEHARLLPLVSHRVTSAGV
ncbi:MAG TPA: thymidine phosphorylase [Gemmatimonadales bacterium]|jgi:pyrimidine-nucleoside phosphorylase|nr:thymidine phosphorylase [Gemmatimonadales bacterium]